MKFISLFIVLFLNLSPAVSQVVVVVSIDSAVDSLNNQQVANIFLAKTNRFPNGDKVTPIEIRNNAIRDQFYRGITGKSENQLNAYWTTLVFTGKGKPPKNLSNYDKLLMQLLDKPNAISYMLANQVTHNLKIVYKFP